MRPTASLIERPASSNEHIARSDIKELQAFEIIFPPRIAYNKEYAFHIKASVLKKV